MNWLAAFGLTTAALVPCVPFEWQPISFGEYTAERAAIIVPVAVSGSNVPLRMQLDTGSGNTHLYGAPGAPASERVADVALRGWPAVTLTLRTEADSEPLDAGAPAGTAGVDLFPHGFVLRLATREVCPLVESDWNWQAMERVNGSPVIPVQDAGRSLRMILDTGSAAFTVLSTPNLSGGVAKATPVRTLSVPSFGRMLSVEERAPRSEFSALGRQLELRYVYAFNDADVEAQLRSARIHGLIGLSAFTGDIAFDFARDRIGYRAPPR